MLSRAQEARVRDVLANHPPGTMQTYCLEHLAAAVKIPPGHLADLAAFVRSLREHGACQTQYGGICDADAHETARLLIWGPPTAAGTFVNPAVELVVSAERRATRLRRDGCSAGFGAGSGVAAGKWRAGCRLEDLGE